MKVVNHLLRPLISEASKREVDAKAQLARSKEVHRQAKARLKGDPSYAGLSHQQKQAALQKEFNRLWKASMPPPTEKQLRKNKTRRAAATSDRFWDDGARSTIKWLADLDRGQAKVDESSGRRMPVTENQLRRIIREELTRESSSFTIDDGRAINLSPGAREVMLTMMHTLHLTRPERESYLNGSVPIPSKWVPRLVKSGAVVAKKSTKTRYPDDSAYDKLLRKRGAHPVDAHNKLLRLIKRELQQYKGWEADYAGDGPESDAESIVGDMADGVITSNPELGQLAKLARIDSWHLRDMVADALYDVR